jgi:DNA-binding MarR family transcriptional regulator
VQAAHGRDRTKYADILLFRIVIEPLETTCVCTTLRMATRTIARLYDDALAPAGLRTTQYSILARLRIDGPAPIGRLAARLLMDRTTLAREVGPLVEAGLVEVAAGEDRRQRVLAVTETGRRLLRRARPLWEAAQASVAERFGTTRTDALLAELRTLSSATR